MRDLGIQKGDRVAITHRGTFDPATAPDVFGVTCDITDSAALLTETITLPLVLEHVSVGYGQTPALRDVSLRFERGERFACEPAYRAISQARDHADQLTNGYLAAGPKVASASPGPM